MIVIVYNQDSYRSLDRICTGALEMRPRLFFVGKFYIDLKKRLLSNAVKLVFIYFNRDFQL